MATKAEPTRQYERPTLTAAANNSPFDAGCELTTSQLVEAIESKRHALRSGVGSGEFDVKYPVATVEAPTPPDARFLGQFSRFTDRKIEAVVNPTALTAAGICAPYTVDYTIDAIGVVDRPLKASLPQFIADRGGVQFRRDVDTFATSGPSSATGTWSMATDANPGAAVKNVWDVPCASVVAAEVAAITYGLRFSNVTQRFDPEATAANTMAAAVAHARYAEVALLNSMFAQTTVSFSTGKQVSATRDLLVALDKTLAYARSSRRLGSGPVLRVVMREWIKDLFRVDLTRAMHTANEDWLAVEDEKIERWFANRGCVVTWVLDGRGPQAQSGPIPATPDQNYTPLTGTQAIPAFPAFGEILIYPEGAFVFLDGGSLDIGIVRDQQLVQTNKYVQFQESWEGVYRKAPEAIRLVVELAPTGGSSGTITPSSIAA